MAARNPVAGASSSYMHNYPMQGRYMPPHHNIMVRNLSLLSLFHVYSAFVHDEISSLYYLFFKTVCTQLRYSAWPQHHSFPQIDGWSPTWPSE